MTISKITNTIMYYIENNRFEIGERVVLVALSMADAPDVLNGLRVGLIGTVLDESDVPWVLFDEVKNPNTIDGSFIIDQWQLKPLPIDKE